MKNNNLVILTSFSNNLLKNRAASSPIKKADFPSADHYKRWNTIAERILNTGYEVRIATREGRKATVSQLYQFDIAFDCLVNTYFKTQSIILGDLDSLKSETLKFVYEVKVDKEEKQEGALPQLSGLRKFKRHLEELLADRIVGKKYRTLEEQLRLKEERAARRKAKREAAKAAKKAAAEAKAREEAETITYQGEIVNVEILTLPNKI